jgi:hypothetical protein
MTRIEQIQASLEPLQAAIVGHPVLQCLTDLAAVRRLMTQHAFAVWDFVCLIKVLYSRLVVTGAPWYPPDDPDSVRLLYEILISEETDDNPNRQGSQYVSHFTLYHQAMSACGANTAPIDQCLARLRVGDDLTVALSHPDILPSTRQFVEHTFASFTQPTHVLAAGFVFGREALVPHFFEPWLDQLTTYQIPHCEALRYYLDRHVTLDKDEHFPKAAQMLINLCGDNEAYWQQVEIAAHSALTVRLHFLDGMKKKVKICQVFV